MNQHAARLQYDTGSDHLTLRDFRRLAQFINDYSGIKMPEVKKTMLEGRLRRRLRATGCPTFIDYCRFLFDEDGLEQEAPLLIDAVTTNKTDFFREPAHFEFLRQRGLPDLRAQGINSVRAWSSACSVGAEPYTLAMVLADFAEDHGPMSFFVLATDLSTDVLASAQQGIYPLSMLDPVPTALRRRYVRVSGAVRPTREPRARIVPELRSTIGFARMNLMDDAYAVGNPMHIIFCRNVLIYFDKVTQAQVLRRLCDCLQPGGYLFIGHSESATGFDLPLRAVSNTVLQRIPS
ncbi:MAG: CheR family methyltransferase [Ancalomicrobiaceae bacterium]|nr:CheR family methyltransferase [Ancalomicrobiaceae bacterium]